MEKPTQKDANKNGNAMKYAAVGTQMLALLGLSVFGGIKLDEKLNISPLLIIVFPVVALIFSLYHLYRQLVKKQ